MSEIDPATQINHLAAEHLGRIFGEKEKAKVQAIIDKAIATEVEALRREVERLTRRVDELTLELFTDAKRAMVAGQERDEAVKELADRKAEIELACKVYTEYTTLKHYYGDDRGQSVLKAHTIMVEVDNKRVAAEQQVATLKDELADANEMLDANRREVSRLSEAFRAMKKRADALQSAH